MKLLCNNEYDCSDGTDEFGCAASTASPTTTFSRICRLDEFTCSNGQCISVSYRCNNNYDCADGSDEYNCPPPTLSCSSTEFRCSNGQQCIDIRGKCNGHIDCFDRSDEEDCPKSCRYDQFTCHSGDCIEQDRVCNGVYNCPDGSDEYDCPTSVNCNPIYEFACRDGRQCIDNNQRCNQQLDCIDRSDEENCEDQFRCQSGEKIPSNLVCNSYPDCRDGSDEHCAGHCRDDEFQCSSSKECILMKSRCNGAYDCSDRSDEQFCTDHKPPTDSHGTIKLVTIPANQTIEQGRQVVFRCRDEGDTRAPVRWVRHGHNTLPPKSTDVRGRLTIDDVQLSSAGDYYCEAQGVPLNTPHRRRGVTLTITQFVKPTLPPGPAICSYNQTTCRSGMCIPKGFVCDGKYDCDDQSDEDRCNLLGCEPNEFECDNRRCVQKSWVCDSDDDCLDGSDENNCGTAPPGSSCEVFEFTCQTNEQCIPKYFVCDNEMDCQDGTDEFGCSKPIITEHPQRNNIVELGQTFTLTCRTVGMPVPEINWRYNWGHVPKTCTSTSVDGFGTLTCVNVQVNHQGAYSCEAVNSLGRTFAVPDAIIQIREAIGTGICKQPTFNANAVSQRECIHCFCFGITDQCSSTDQYISTLSSPKGQFRIIGINQDQYQGTYVIRENEYPISSSYARVTSHEKVEIYIPDRARLGGPTDMLVYFSLPDGSSFKGPQLGSYAGNLRFKISHRVSGFGQKLHGPDIILKGSNITIMYVSDKSFKSDVDTEVEIALLPGQWYKKVTNKGGNLQSQDPATRQDIMMVLQYIDLILIRASYSDGLALEATLTDVQLESIDFTSTSSGRAFSVESCRCPDGYTGMSCETCAPNYKRIHDGSFIGRCTLNISCGPTEFGDPSNGIPCQLCPCPLTNPSNQFSQSCYLDSDGQVTCNCQTGYAGRRCQACSSGYNGNPSIPGDSCRPSPPDCNWDEFICVDMTQCMHKNLRCDGKIDCRDGSDETYCNSTSSTTSSPGSVVERVGVTCITTFNCHDGSIHPWSRRCDGIPDCHDHEDEFECQVCFNSAHRCSNGKCVNFERICDGIYDCPDATDEISRNCIDELPCNHLTDFTCADQTCISNDLQCDGKEDCIDGFDELYCNCVCNEPFSHMCADGKCIRGNSSSVICNGVADCDDESDELKCCTSSASFVCDNGDCINLSLACDGSFDCKDGTDEIGCCDELSEFKCGDGFCIDRNLYCNGLYDCEDGTDEPRSCPETCNPDFEYKCNDGSCISSSKFCDFHIDCLDGSDESLEFGCCNVDTHFSCFNGKCLNRQHECNGIEDCLDGSDELNCPGECDRYGSYSKEPDHITGLCRCKEHTTGPKCNQCQASAFYLNENSKHGCIKCFCMGVSNNCTSSNWYRAQEVIGFVGDTQGVLMVDQYQKNTIMNNLYVDDGTQELVYRDFSQMAPDTYYWKLPRKFVKDKVSSYGGNLTYTIRYTTPNRQLINPRGRAHDVEIYGNDVTMRYFNQDSLPTAGSTHTLSVPFFEQYWKRQDGQVGNREHFLMALADLEYILIRATYSTQTIDASLKEIRLDYASGRNTGQNRAFSVEACECPQGYKGLSCEDCAAGYTRDYTALYLGECKICDCKGYSDECDPETGVCMNCRNNRGGDFCERCASGFTEDYTGLCIRSNGCSCDPKGSQTTECINDKCICKENVEGDECKTCRSGYFHLSHENPDGCLKCWCSGATDRCSSSYLHNEQIPMNLFDDHNFTLTNRARTNVITDLDVNIAENRLTFGKFADLPPLQTYYWSLPQLFTGNKLSSYGGYLRLKQNVEWQTASDLYADADIIIIGADQREFIWVSNMGSLSNSMWKNISVKLVEDNFSHNQAPARRGDFLSALASIEAILIRATLSSSVSSSSLRDVVMDTAVDYSSGQSRALDVEQCSCPFGHTGNSCEDCAQGYYKDLHNRCLRCECSGKEQSCSMDNNRRLKCICLPGYTGERCEISGRDTTVPIGNFEIRIPQSEYIAESGGTIELHCEVSAPVSTQMTIAWDKESGVLPVRRTSDDRSGTLTISQVRPYDSGVYICRASTGVQVKESRTYLNVTGGPPPSKPVVVIDEHREELFVRIGEFIRVRCRASGSPPPQVQWYRQDGRPLSLAVSQTDGILTLNNPQRVDTGTYVCMGQNREGSTQATITILVDEQTVLPPVDRDEYIIVQVPENVEAQDGGFVRIVCTVPLSQFSGAYKWTRMQYSLPEHSTQSRGELIIPSAKSSDSGMYTCTVTDGRGRTGKSTTNLIILPSGTPPEVKIEPEMQTINQGTKAELKCVAKGDPTPIIRWTKENEEMSRNARIEGDILRIENAAVSDRGLYRCSATNSHGEGRSVAVLEVEMREPPVVEMYPDNRATIRKGESASFLCHLTKGYPNPTISWARTDGKQMTQNTKILTGGVIKFNQVTGPEEGSYICTASNDAGKMTAVATLEIEAVPIITLRPHSRTITIQTGERIHLECSTDGDPLPTVSWQKLQSNVPQNMNSKSITPRVSIYEVQSARISDQGIYQCTAQNSAGTTIERLQVIVRESLPAFPHPVYPAQKPESDSDTSRRFQIPLGGQFEFKCTVEGLHTDRQEYTFEFRRSDGRPLPREHIKQDHSLTVSNVDRAVQGEYACIITEESTHQIITTIYATLEVIDPPKITLEPARQVVRPGDNANLRCSVTGDQPITITWSKQTGAMPPSVIINGGMLMFRGIQVTDAGKYLCEAVNPVGRAEAVAEVLVNELPLLTSLQQNVILSEGQDGELRCIPSGLSPSAVHWIKEGADIPNNIRPSGSVLRIHHATTNNSGRYKCEARTHTGDYTYDYVELVVQQSRNVDVEIRSSTDNVKVGDIVDLYCDVVGQQRALVSWSKQGSPLPYNSRVDGNRLRLASVDQNSAGVYICSAQTQFGLYEMKYPLTIQSTVSATRSVDTRSVQFGSTVKLKCDISASSTGSFSWSKQGGQLPSRAVIQEDYLEIPKVEADDAGTYLCSSNNGQNGAKSPTLLIVTGVVPRFNGESYLALPTLRDAYLFFELEISLKPEREDGLVLYNSQQDGQGDFISFGLNNSYAEFRFDVGSGPAILRSLEPLKMGEWNTIKLTRNRKEGTMSVNGGPTVSGKSEGRFQGLDLIKPLYIGGIPDFSVINNEAGFSTGFVGCISQLVVGTTTNELMRNARSKNGVVPCNTCSDNPCENGGVCQEAYSPTGHKCKCSGGYSGISCESTGEQCYPGVCGSGHCINRVDGFDCQCPFGTAGLRCDMIIDITEPSFKQQSFLAYRTPRALKRFSVGLRVKPKNLDDGIVMYCAQQEKGDGDFASLAIRNNRLEFKFNTGTGTALIKSEEISPNTWIKVLANRTDQTGTLQINDGVMQNIDAPGSSRALNLRTPLYFGGVDKSHIEISPEVQVQDGFTGCIADLEIMDQPVRFGNALLDSSNVDQCGALPCSRTPCRNGGTCHTGGNNNEDYKCDCQPGFTGEHCEIRSGLCDRQQPCLNGGICRDISETAFECDCSLGYSGTDCRQESYLRESAAFYGSSWIELDRYMLHQDGISEQDFSLEFSTESASGLLFWLGQEENMDGAGKDFLSLGVVDGFLELSLGMGGDVNKVRSEERVNDGSSHTAVIRKLGNEASLILDNRRHLVARASENAFSFNTDGNIFIGGTPNLKLMTASKFTKGFDGCIQRMAFGTRKIDNINNSALSGSNVDHCNQ